MKIKDTDIYQLKYFTYKKPFTGSMENMRYHIAQKKEEEDTFLEAAVYPQPYCWEETPEEQKQRKLFEFSEDGRHEMIEWLNQKVSEFSV